MKKSTAQTTRKKSIQGDSKTEKLAAMILPILVRQAKAHKTITYGALAKEINRNFKDFHANPHGMIGQSLGIIGNELSNLNPPPPLINSCVVNQKTGEPSGGVDEFMVQRLSTIKPTERPLAIRLLQEESFSYSRWNEVLEKFELKPAISDLSNEPSPKYYAGGGEGPEHKKFKAFVQQHPEKLHLPKSMSSSAEYGLLSGDRLDLIFENQKQVVGIEVKSAISGVDDIQRGLFQAALPERDRLSRFYWFRQHLPWR